MPHWRECLGGEARGARYLPWKEVARATGLSRTTAWRLQKRDDFPAPYAISPGRVGYREDEVEAWRVSRDRRGARVRPGPAEARVSVRPPSSVREATPRSERLTPGVREDPSEAAPEPRLGALLVSGGASPSRDRAAAQPSRSGRRRSQHAKAIAQQMMFDF